MAATGFCDLRAAARRIGPAYVQGWQKEGADEFAPSAAEDAAELRAIAEMTDQQLKDATRAWHKSIEKAAAAERAARQEAGAAPSGVKEALPGLRKRIAEVAATERAARQGGEREKTGELRRYRARLKKLLASLEASAVPVPKPRARGYTREVLDETRMRLMDEAAARHEDHLAARLRWQTAIVLIRDQAFGGAVLTVALLPDRTTIPLTAEECRACWPPAGKTRTMVAHEGFTVPATFLIREADIGRALPKAKSALRDGDGAPAPIADTPRRATAETIQTVALGLPDLTREKLWDKVRDSHPDTPRQDVQDVLDQLKDKGRYIPKQGPHGPRT